MCCLSNSLDPDQARYFAAQTYNLADDFVRENLTWVYDIVMFESLQAVTI